MKVDIKQDYVVAGVFKDLPKNVSFYFSWLAPFKIYMDQISWLKSWGNNGIVTYVETEPNADITLSIKSYMACTDQRKRSQCTHVHLSDESLEDVRQF